MDLEVQCMQIISNVGGAKSCYVSAIAKAREGDVEGAKKLIAEGQEMFEVGHHAHLEIFNAELDKDFSTAHFLLIHAEDQLMAADSFKILAEEFIALYEKFSK